MNYQKLIKNLLRGNFQVIYVLSVSWLSCKMFNGVYCLVYYSYSVLRTVAPNISTHLQTTYWRCLLNIKLVVCNTYCTSKCIYLLCTSNSADILQQCYVLVGLCFNTQEAESRKQAVPADGEEIPQRGLTSGVERKAIDDLSAGSFPLCQSMTGPRM